MATQKPAIALIPGGWLASSSYDGLIQLLNDAGYATICAALPSLDPKNPSESSIQQDADHIRTTVLEPLVKGQGRDVVLLMHSYGAEPGSSAALDLSRSDRARERNTGGVIGFISFNGFILSEGASCADGQGGNLPPWVLQHTPSQDLTMPDEPRKYLFNEVPETVATLVESEVRPHARGPFYQPQPKPAWLDPCFEGCLGFIMARNDNAVPIEGQRAMAQYSSREWSVVEIEGGHCAHLGSPMAVAEAVVKLIQGFKPPTS